MSEIEKSDIKMNNNETGIIFVDVAKDVAEEIGKAKQPLLQKLRRMKKLQSIIILLLLTLTIFSGINLLSTASATTTPLTSDAILLSNSQSTPTSTNFDQLLKMDWTNYANDLNSNVSNVRFYGSSSLSPSSELYAWMENNNTTSATSSNVWVNLSNVIVPADGSTNIYVAFLPKTSSWSSHWGLAPQLSTTYGQFDNGANVFGKSNYTNFSNLSDANNFLDMGAVTSSYTFSNGIIFPNGITSTEPNDNTIASNIKYKYGDYLGFDTVVNIITSNTYRVGYGYASNNLNSYWIGLGGTTNLQVVNQTGSAYIYGSIATPNMTYIQGYIAETTAGVPFAQFGDTSITSGTTITPINHRAFIQLNSGYGAFHYMFVGSENGAMPTAFSSSTYNTKTPPPTTTNNIYINGTYSSTSMHGIASGLVTITNTAPTATVSWTLPSGLVSETVSWNYILIVIGGNYISSSVAQGTYYASYPTSIIFTYHPGTYSGSVQVDISYSITGSIIISNSFSSGAIPVTINRMNQNWWNSSIASYNVTIPTGSYSVYYTVNHVLSVGYVYGAQFDALYYTGSSSNYINPQQQFSSISNGFLSNGGVSKITFATQELINYDPIIVSDSVHFSGTGSTADINLKAVEVMVLSQYITISWGDGGTNVSSYQSGAWFNYSHQYTSSGDYRVTATVYNKPQYTSGALSASQTVLYNITISTSFTPISNSILYAGSVATILLSTDGNVVFNNVTLSVNGLNFYPSFSYSGNTLTSSYTLPQSGNINYQLIWTLTGGGISQTYKVYYYAPRTPGEYADWLGMSYANGIPPTGMEFAIPVTISNNQGLSTNASMPELLYIDWSTYNTYLASNLSNVEFYTTNFVPLYAWIENGATSTAKASDVWVNLGSDIIPAHSSITIYIGIFSTSTDNFGVNKYLGLAPWLTTTYGQSDNGHLVFSDYWNFSGSSLPSGFVAGSGYGGTVGGNYYIHNGIYVNATSDVIGEYEVMYNQPITLSNYVVDSVGMLPVDGGGTTYMISNGQLPSSSATNSEGTQYIASSLAEVSGGYYDGSKNSRNITATITWVVPQFTWYMLSDNVFGSDPSHSSELIPNATSSSYVLSYNENWSAPSGIGKLGYIGLGNMYSPAVTYSSILDARVAPPNNVMPSAVYSSAVPVSSFVTLRYPFEVTVPLASNNTLSVYTYTIVKTSNSPTIYLYYNSSWQLNSITSNFYTILPSNCIQIDNLTGVTTIYVTFVEPSRIANPYATIILNLIPSVAVGQVSGIFLPVSYMAVYVNGQELYSNSYQDAVIGNPYTIVVKDAFLTTILTTTVTPTSQNFPVFLYLNLSEITWRNMNQNSSINIYASQNGFTQQEIAVGADSISPVFYFLDGTYNFTYDFETYSVIDGVSLGAGIYKTITASVQMNGLMSQIFYGYSLLQVAQEINTTTSNITNSISKIYINLYLQGDSIQNLTLALMLNLSIENSSIHNTLITLLNNITFLQDALGNTNTSLATKLNFVDSLLNSTAISISNKINVVESILNSTTFSLTTKINFVDSLLNSTAVSLTSKLNFINSVLNSTTISLADKINFADSLLNNTQISLTDKLNFINSDLNNTNISLAAKIAAVDSAVDNANISLTTKINFVDSLMNNTNVLLASRINFLDSLLNNTNISLSSKINFINSTLKSTNVLISSKINFVDSLLNSTQISLADKINLVNSVLNSTNISLHSRLNFINSILNNTNLSLTSKINFVDSTLNNTNILITSKINFVNSLLNNTDISLTDKINFADSLLNNTNALITTKINLINTTLHDVNISLATKINFVDSLLNNTNVLMTSKIDFVDSLLNNTDISLADKINFVDSTLNSTNVLITSKINFIDSIMNKTNLSLADKINFVDSVLNNTNVLIAAKINFADSVMNNTELSLATKINFLDSVMNNTGISLTAKINFVDSLLNNTNVSLATKINFLNSSLKTTNVLITSRIDFVDSLLNSTTISLADKIYFMDSLLNNTDVSLATKLNFINSTLNSTTISLTDRIDFVDSLLNNTQISLATKLNFVSSLLNSTNVSIATKLNVLSSSLTDLNLSVKQEFNLLNATLHSINVSIDSKITLLNTTLSNMNVSLNDKINLVNSVLIDMNASLNTKITLINTAINSLSISLNDKIALINTAIVNMNVSLNDKITIINSVLSNMNISLGTKIAFVNDTLNNLNLSLKTKLDFMWSALNNTNISVAAKVNILNSSLHDLNLNMKQDFGLLNSTINSLNASIKTQVNEIMDSINDSKLNISTRITVIKGLLGIVMNKQNISSVDRIQLTDPQMLGNNTYRFVADVYTPSGAPVNLSVTQYVASNLILRFVQGYDAQPLAYSISNIQPGSFTVTIFGLNSTNIASLNSNNAVVTASSNTSANKSANVVVLGLLGSFLAGNQWQHTLLILFQPIVWRISAMDILLTLISLYAFLVISRFMRQSKSGRKKAWQNTKYHLFLWSLAFLGWFLMYAAYRGGML